MNGTATFEIRGGAGTTTRPCDVGMPEGLYFSLSGMITATTGGQTRALLMRNRLLAERCGVAPVLLTFDSRPHYALTRARLREQRQLVDPMRLLNIYEHHRELDIDGLVERGDLGPASDALPPLDGLDAREDRDDDGRVYRTRHVHPSSHEDAAHDYRRPDGSVFLRVPVGPPGWSPVAEISLVDRSGRRVDGWPDQRAWRQAWLSSLAGPDPDTRVFVVSDSRFALAHVLPMTDDRFHLLHVMHSTHLAGQRLWSSPIAPDYAPLLESLAHLDGLVTLTDRQRADVAARYGATTNLYVVPNPVEPPAPPDPAAVRARQRFVVVARLGPQKHLEEAVRVFALVVAAEPGATLDIYGSGPSRSAIEAEITAQGLEGSITLRGHDPNARDTLWTATGFLMTSRFEGYPLATLEAFARGCPVVSYDVTYGPREQITDGVDGYVVAPGERQAMADRIVGLIRDPRLVARMSRAAIDKAGQHDHTAFLGDWRRVFEDVVAAKGRRTTIDSVTLEITRLGVVRPLRVPGRLAGPFDRRAERLPGLVGRVGRRLLRRTSGSRTSHTPPRVEFVGRLDVRGRSRDADLSTAVVTLDAVGHPGVLVPVPVTVRRSETTFSLSATVDVCEVYRSLGGPVKSLALRLRLVWGNSAWETTLTRPRRMAPRYEVSFSGTGELALLRGRVRALPRRRAG